MINRIWLLAVLLCGCGTTAVPNPDALPVMAAGPKAQIPGLSVLAPVQPPPAPLPTPLPTPLPAPLPVPLPTPLPVPLPAPTLVPLLPEQPVPAPISAPTPVEQPPAPPAAVEPLIVDDASVVTVTLSDAVLSIRLADLLKETWMRIVMPDGRISQVTRGPGCDCLGLSGQLLNTINVDFRPGMRIEFSNGMAGPWNLAARTLDADPVPVQDKSASAAPGLTLGDTSIVTTRLNAGTVTVQLTDDHVGSWMKLVLKDGSVSPLTISPECACIGMGGNSPHMLRFGAFGGMRVMVSANMDGPWILAASTY